jgi:hypothetical protein
LRHSSSYYSQSVPQDIKTHCEVVAIFLTDQLLATVFSGGREEPQRRASSFFFYPVVPETYNLFPETDPSLRVRCSNGRGEKNEATKEDPAHPDFSR